MDVDYTLYLVADVDYAAGRDLVALIEAAVRGGVTVVQLRAKGLPFREFQDLKRAEINTPAATGAAAFINLNVRHLFPPVGRDRS